MVSKQLFEKLVKAASLAPSADNMQAWEFEHNNDTIAVYYARNRALPTDCNNMFGWIGTGAAIQNMVEEARANGLQTSIMFNNDYASDLAATLTFMADASSTELAEYIPIRCTSRNPFLEQPLPGETMNVLVSSIEQSSVFCHHTQEAADYRKIARLDAKSSYIRLEHKPFHDELFEILRFSKKDIEKHRFGLTFDSLEVPRFAVFFAQQLQYWSFNRLVSQLGFGKMVARQLSEKLCRTGSILLLTVSETGKQNYIEAGMALETLWLKATQMGLQVQPYGVLPQYFAHVEHQPQILLPKYRQILAQHREVFNTVFPEAQKQSPAMVLRIGKAQNPAKVNTVRLYTHQLIRN